MKHKHMKNSYFLLAAGLFAASCGPSHMVYQSGTYQQPAPAPAPAPVEDVSYQSFYDQLSPYGNWINYPGYGYVWMPDAGPDFRPYASNGNWIYTEAGWTWSSNYSWGWAPFHYGRWFYENGYGWMWVPGNEWAPAWVSWRGGGDYYGWAPLAPRISADMAMSNYNPPAYYWNFVPRQYMGNPGGPNYYVHDNRNLTIINQTTIINNYSGMDRNRYAYAPGPDPNEVRRYSGNNFTPVQIRQSGTPGERVSGTDYVIYHPRVSNSPVTRGDAAGRPSTPAPARYESFSNLRPSNQNPSYNQPDHPQPANNPGPAMRNPGYSQPDNPPSVNNARPALQNASNNQPVNNQPVNNTGSTSQSATNHMNDFRMNQISRTTGNPHTGQPQPGPQPAPVNRVQTNGRPGTVQNPGNGHPAPQPAMSNGVQTTGHPVAVQNPGNGHPVPQPAMGNRVQTTGRPAAVRNPGNVQPVPRNAKPEEKPEQRSTEKPRTREADNN